MQRQLEDFAGTWRILPDSPAVSNQGPPPVPGAGPPPNLQRELRVMRPEAAARLGAPAPAGDRGYCAPPAFAGRTGFASTPGATLALNFEILPSPGRLTLLDEVGLIRRIHLRDTPPPDALEESNGGTTVARFEGATLVARTTGLNPRAQTLYGIPATELGRGATIDERFTRVGADELEITTTVTAPQLYAAPVTSTNRYRRNPAWSIVEMVVCVDDDRSYDHATRTERFEATPPPDLPPPPSN